MTTALIKKMKNEFGFDRHELKQLAESSKLDALTDGGVTILTEEQKINGGFTRTTGVNLEKVSKYLRDVLTDYQEPINLNIYPLMLQQNCFANSREFATSFDMDVSIGFNITSCECSDFISFELHAIPVDKNGKYYDITEDFCGEKNKWFIPIHTVKNEDLNTLMWRIKTMRGDGDGYFYTQGFHSCNKAIKKLGKTKCYAPHGENAITKKKDVIELLKKYKKVASTPIIVY